MTLRQSLAGLLFLVGCNGNPNATNTDASADGGSDAVQNDGGLNATTEGTPGQFDPDTCAAYTAHFLDGTSGQTHRCTGVYYGGQTNLGQCVGAICYNEMEVILPTNFVKGTRVPALVYIHGGGWATGSYAEGNAAQSEDYLSRGLAVISLNYRLSPQKTSGDGMGLDPMKSDPNFYFDESNPWSTTMMGGDPMVVAPTRAANYYQWLASPTSYLDTSSAPI